MMYKVEILSKIETFIQRVYFNFEYHIFVCLLLFAYMLHLNHVIQCEK